MARAKKTELSLVDNTGGAGEIVAQLEASGWSVQKMEGKNPGWQAILSKKDYPEHIVLSGYLYIEVLAKEITKREAALALGWDEYLKQFPDEAERQSKMIEETPGGQKYLPGGEPGESFPDVEQAAKDAYEATRARVDLSNKETKANEWLVAVMKKHGLKEYHNGGFHVTEAKPDKVKYKVQVDADTEDSTTKTVTVSGQTAPPNGDHKTKSTPPKKKPTGTKKTKS